MKDLDESTRAYVSKVIGSVAAFGFGVYLFAFADIALRGQSSTSALAGALIAAGLAGLGVNIGATIAAGREAAALRLIRRQAALPQRQRRPR